MNKYLDDWTVRFTGICLGVLVVFGSSGRWPWLHTVFLVTTATTFGIALNRVRRKAQTPDRL